MAVMQPLSVPRAPLPGGHLVLLRDGCRPPFSCTNVVQYAFPFQLFPIADNLLT